MRGQRRKWKKSTNGEEERNGANKSVLEVKAGCSKVQPPRKGVGSVHESSDWGDILEIIGRQSL